MESIHPRVLEGWQLSLYRFARRTGLVLAGSRVYQWYRLHIRRTIPTPSWFIDPLGPTQVMLAMAPAISACRRDSISIPRDGMATWLPAALTCRPDFCGERSYRDVFRWLGDGTRARCDVTSGDHKVSYAAIVRNGELAIEVLHRSDEGPKRPRGQLMRFYQTIHAAPELNAETVAAAREEAFSRDWPDPFPESQSPDPEPAAEPE